MPEVICHEPKRALDGHEDGLYFYRKIVEQAPLYLKPGGRLLFEIGYDRGERRPDLLAQAGFCDIAVIKIMPVMTALSAPACTTCSGY